MKKSLLSFCLLLSLNSVPFGAQAASHTTNLLDVFNQALISDPQFQTDRTTLQSNEENIPIARSLLLPQAFIQGTSEYNILNVRNGGSLGGQGTFHYGSNNYGITVDQVIFNFADWASFQESKASVKAATATYGAQYQQLIVDVATAYFNVLEAKDILNYTLIERRAVRRLYDQNVQRYRVGIGTITDVYNAKADLDNIISQEIGARTNLINARENLRAITGRMYPSLASLRDNVPLHKPIPEDRAVWSRKASVQNLSVLAAHYSEQAAREQVHVAFAGHFPTINAVGSYQENHAGNNGFSDTNQGSGAVGIGLDIPVFQGGLVVAQTQQSEYDYQTSLSNLDAAIRDAINSAQQNYNNVIAGVSKIKADKQAIISNESSLESTEAAFKVGTRTIIDVLEAQTNLFQTQTTFAQDLYSYIISTLVLKQAAGTLNPQDLLLINHWLTNRVQLVGTFSVPTLKPSPNLNRPAPTFKPTPEQKQEELQQLKNLPIFTPQPDTPWTNSDTAGGTASTSSSNSTTSGSTSTTTNTNDRTAPAASNTNQATQADTANLSPNQAQDTNTTANSNNTQAVGDGKRNDASQ